MRLTQGQLRRVINEEASRLSEAKKKPTRTGTPKPRSKATRFESELTTMLADYFSAALDEVIANLDINQIIDDVCIDLEDEISARPETLDYLADVDVDKLGDQVAKKFEIGSASRLSAIAAHAADVLLAVESKTAPRSKAKPPSSGTMYRGMEKPPTPWKRHGPNNSD